MTNETKRTNGKFVKGTSGNPSGRPRGSQNKSTQLMESMLNSEAFDLMRKAIEMAKAGDGPALKMCMDRLMAPRRDRPVTFSLPRIRSLSDVSIGMASILAAVSEGQITPQEGESISRILEAHARTINMQELQARVEELEKGPSEKEEVVITKSYK